MKELVEYDWNEDTGVGTFVYEEDGGISTRSQFQMTYWTQPKHRTPRITKGQRR